MKLSQTITLQTQSHQLKDSSGMTSVMNTLKLLNTGYTQMFQTNQEELQNTL